jgi:hypothetical protein
LLSDELYRRIRFDDCDFVSPAQVYPWTAVTFSYAEVLLAWAVFAIEASCLARNGRDRHRLIEFCGLVGRIIIDEDGIYEPRSQTSAFFFVPDLAIDEIADLVAILFLLLEKCTVAGFNLDIVVRRGRDSVLACIGFLKRNQLRYRPRLAFILIGHRRAVGRARERRSLNNGPAFRACNGRFVEIEETHAALLALVLVTEFRFGHGTYLSKGRLFGRVSDLKPACQMEVEPRCRLPESLQSPSAQPRTKRILWELGLGGSDNLGIWGFPRGRKSDSRLIFGDQSWIARSCAMINGNA